MEALGDVVFRAFPVAHVDPHHFPIALRHGRDARDGALGLPALGAAAGLVQGHTEVDRSNEDAVDLRLQDLLRSCYAYI